MLSWTGEHREFQFETTRDTGKASGWQPGSSKPTDTYWVRGCTYLGLWNEQHLSKAGKECGKEQIIRFNLDLESN